MHEATYLPKEFYTKLENNQNLLQYLTIGTIPRRENEEKNREKEEQIKKWRNESIQNLTNFRNMIKDGSFEDRPLVIKPVNQNKLWFYHQLKFLQKLILKKLHQKYEESVLLCQSAIDILSDSSKIPGIDISFNELELYQKILAQPYEIRSLLSKENYLIEQINNEQIETKNDLKNEILEILKDAKTVAGSITNYFPVNSKQARFEELLLCNESPAKPIIEDFLNNFETIPKEMFHSSIAQIFYEFFHILDINDGKLLSLGILMFMRAIYDICYTKSPQYFHIESQHKVSDYIDKIQCSIIDPPPNIIKCDPTDNVAQIFSNDEEFQKCFPHFYEASFYTNPLDALNEIQKVLIKIVTISNKRIGEKGPLIMPFETSFSLFLGALIAAKSPNFEETANFISTFTPTEGLSPEFEYALTTTTASLRFCENLASRFQENSSGN